MMADRIKQKTNTQQQKRNILKHNTAKKNKRTLFFFEWYIDECKNNVNERNNVLFSKAEKKRNV
jgi:ferritin